MKLTYEQRQQLQSITIVNGINALDYVLQQPEDNRYWIAAGIRYWIAAGILSCVEKGRILNRMTIFWEAEDLRNPPPKNERESRQYAPSKELTEKLTEEQKHQIQEITIANGTNAWDYVLSWPADGQYWIALGILSCVEHSYGLTRLEINWEARDLQRKTAK